jgi:putative MATE family efflux protein
MAVFTKVKDVFTLIIQAIKGEEQDYTSGSINRAILLLSVPMIIEMSMESIFAVVDIFFVSQLNDTDALAVVGQTESVLSLIYSLAFGLSMAATAFVARRIGEKDVKGAEDAAVQAIYLSVGLSLILTVLGLVFAEDVLILMGAEEGVLKHVLFTKIMYGGNLSIVMLFMINAVFRGAGDAALAMRALLLGNVINIILDPLFIFGWGPFPELGVTGAAVATTTGRSIAVMYQLYHLTKGSSKIKIHVETMKVKLDLIWSMVKVSAGGIGQMLIASGSWIFLMRLMSDFGTAAQGGYVIAIRIIVFAILPGWGMANASATLVGQNLGAGHPDRAEKSVWRAGQLNMIFLAIITVLFFSMADFILGFFTKDAEVLRNGIQCLQIVSLGYIFYAYGMVVSQSFNGAGDTRTPTIINLVGFWLFQIPLAYVLVKYFETGPIGVYAAISIAESLMAVVSIYIFRKGKWKLTRV